MKKLIIEKEFWNVFPDAKIGVVVAQGVDNSLKDQTKYQIILENAQIQAKKHLTTEVFSENPTVKVWREAYQKFKTKKGARSSIEALLKRVQNGQQINNINPLVDIYNSISLEFGLPCGGEDIDKIVGDMKLTKALGHEDFLTLGSDKQEPPYEGEIVYKDDWGAICRCLNWRESTRTMLTETTRNSVLCLEMVNGQRLDDLNTALTQLATKIEKNLGGTCQIQILDCNNYELMIN